MGTSRAYDVPSAAGGDAGLEGFSVVAGDERVGRVAALNRLADGLVLLVDTGTDYRAVSTEAVERVEIPPGRVVLTRPLDAPAVTPAVRRADTPQLVRHIPRELDRLVVAGGLETGRRSPLWYVGSVVLVVGGVGSIGGPIATAESSGSLRWLWTAIPVLVFAVGAALLWTAYGSASRVRLSRRERLADAASAVFGISPRTRKRG